MKNSKLFLRFFSLLTLQLAIISISSSQAYTSHINKRDLKGDSLLNIAKIAYANSEYIQVKQILHVYLKNNPSDKKARFYSGMASLQLAQYASAIKHLQIAKSSPDSEISQTALYYLALSFTALQDNNRLAKKAFAKIANDPSSEYQEAAKDILASL